MDPAGIFMLKSVYDKFDSLGIKIQPEIKTLSDPDAIISAIKNGINPVVLARYTHDKNYKVVHAMVAADVREQRVGSETEYFLKCKNSYRDNIDDEGIFHHDY